VGWLFWRKGGICRHSPPFTRHPSGVYLTINYRLCRIGAGSVKPELNQKFASYRLMTEVTRHIG